MAKNGDDRDFLTKPIQQTTALYRPLPVIIYVVVVNIQYTNAHIERGIAVVYSNILPSISYIGF